MDNSFTSLVSGKRVLIVLPTKPYFDQVAAALSLSLSLSNQGNVEVFCPVPMRVEFNRLIGVNQIKSEIGNKNLAIRFKGYDAGNIEKVSYDIENGEFKLAIVPKTGFDAPQKEQLDLSYSGFSADLVILIGGANDSHFPILSSEEVSESQIVHIGTRVLDSTHEVMSFAKPGGSVSELAANLIKENSLEMSPDIASNLVIGIEEGSSNFMSPEVMPETFETVAYLLRAGGQRIQKTRLNPASFPPGAIPTQPFTKPKFTQQAISQQAQISQSGIGQPEPIIEQIEDKEEIIENPPDDWLQPKVFKGTSIS